ncbi:MAG: Rieske 2Fe-2S domain-containing protein [Rhodospirillales bacterium]|nr:Rieske 2Fe-2S domain-containing protein [Rhodospirillales bacterium]
MSDVVSERVYDQQVASAADRRDLNDTLTLDAVLANIETLEALASSWPEEIRNASAARAAAVDSLNAEAIRRLIGILKDVPGFGAALREAAGDEVVYAVLRRHGILKPSLHERVESALQSIRPMLDSHGGDVEVVAIEPPRVDIRLLGACDGCPASALTFYSGVKKAIQDAIPEIREVKQVKGLGGGTPGQVHYASPFAAYKADGWVFAMKLPDLPDGGTLSKDLEGQSVLLSRFGDRVTCFANVCAHMGLALDGGEVKDGFITCPYHGFQYSLESGECLTAPEVQLQPHGVRIVGDRVEIRLTR